MGAPGIREVEEYRIKSNRRDNSPLTAVLLLLSCFLESPSDRMGDRTLVRVHKKKAQLGQTVKHPHSSVPIDLPTTPSRWTSSQISTTT